MLVDREVTSSCGAAVGSSLEALDQVQCLLATSSSHLNIVPNSIFNYVSARWVEPLDEDSELQAGLFKVLLLGMLKVELN